MPDEPEQIRQEIEKTHGELTKKLSLVEDQLVNTVTGATSDVAETIRTVKDSVEGTVEAVKETVEETVETVKRTFDLPYQVRQRPWLMVGGSVVAGFVAGSLLGGRSRAGWDTAGSGGGGDYGTAFQSPATYSDTAARSNGSAAPAAPSKPGLLDRLWESLDGEIGKVKELAIGSLVGMLRDVAKRSLPESLAPQVEEILNNVTTKLGGKVIPGPVLACETEGHHYRQEQEAAAR
jgi:ElaB/YqjD/DUF883 family membrane-anchored ribosome-binding protein